MIALIWAGWTLQPMVGEPSAEALAETELRVAHCPPRQQDFVARQQGEKTVLGPVAGSGETRNLGEIEACLRAGLRAKPLADGVAVRVVYEEPRAEVWSGNVTGILDAADKFNADVHVSNENRELGNGESVNVDVLYLGVSTAFYVNQDGKWLETAVKLNGATMIKTSADVVLLKTEASDLTIDAAAKTCSITMDGVAHTCAPEAPSSGRRLSGGFGMG